MAVTSGLRTDVWVTKPLTATERAGVPDTLTMPTINAMSGVATIGTEDITFYKLKIVSLTPNRTVEKLDASGLDSLYKEYVGGYIDNELTAVFRVDYDANASVDVLVTSTDADGGLGDRLVYAEKTAGTRKYRRFGLYALTNNSDPIAEGGAHTIEVTLSGTGVAPISDVVTA